jgi:hypothetical protein
MVVTGRPNPNPNPIPNPNPNSNSNPDANANPNPNLCRKTTKRIQKKDMGEAFVKMLTAWPINVMKAIYRVGVGDGVTVRVWG